MVFSPTPSTPTGCQFGVGENTWRLNVAGSVELPFKRRSIRIEPTLWVNVERCGHP
jgi:hypothetical protein